MADYVLEGPKWGNPSLGTAGGIVTWAVDATIPAYFLTDLVAAFADWSKYGNIQFEEVAATAGADIDFTMGGIDGLDNILAQTGYYYSGTSLVSAGVEFDSGEGWHVSGSNVISNDNINLFVVALHEIGHAIGLGHYNTAAAVMNAVLDRSVTDLRQSDIDGIEAIYGVSSGSNPPIVSADVSVVPQTGQMGAEWHLANAADYNGDGTGDLIWVRNTTGDAALWTMKNGALTSFSLTQGHMGAEWTAYSASADFNHDGKADLLWTSGGNVAIWEMSGPSLAGFVIPSGQMGAEWQVKGIGDFNGDGNSDILWLSTGNQVAIWSMSGTTLSGAGISGGRMGAEWSIGAVGSFDGSGRDGIVWVDTSGDVSLWSMNGTNVTGLSSIGQMTTAWHIAGAGDFNKDGTDDLVWVDTSNNVQIWEMKSGKTAEIINSTGHVGTEWQLNSVADVTGDGRADLVWVRADGTTSVWDMSSISKVAAATAPDSFHFNESSLAQAPVDSGIHSVFETPVSNTTEINAMHSDFAFDQYYQEHDLMGHVASSLHGDFFV